MAMKVTKRSDLLALMKKEEEERENRKRLEAMLANDDLGDVALDLWDTVKFLYSVTMKGPDFDEGTETELYRQLAEFCAMLENQGFETEWESVKAEVERFREEQERNQA